MSDFTEQEFIEKYDEIKRIETAFLSPEQIPTAYILGGQPGAGKTGIQTEIISQNSNVCIINADSYRKHHPHFDRIQAQYGDSSPQYTQPFINAVIHRVKISTKPDGACLHPALVPRGFSYEVLSDPTGPWPYIRVCGHVHYHHPAVFCAGQGADLRGG